MKYGKIAARTALLFVTLGFLAACMVPEKPAAADTRKAVERRVSAGLEYLRTGSPSDARRHISSALELDSRSPEAHNAMALLYRYEQDDKRAEEHFRRAVRYGDDYAVGQNNYGAFLFHQQRYREALRQFEAAANNPSYENRSVAFANKGRVLMALGEQDQALEAFAMVRRLDSQSLTPLIEMGWLYFERNDLRQADAAYQEYLRMLEGRRQSARALWLGIRLASRQGDLDRRSSLELALEQRYPDSTEFVAWRQWIAGGRP